SPYPWQITDFEKPPTEKLVIYELLIRDFLETHDYKTLRDTLGYLKSLGVNAIELMPVMEFSGNNSWGYNPIYHLAADKYYGPAIDFKSFVDSAHANGIAVIMDMVLNQCDNLSPLAMLYWDKASNRPAVNNPWLNQSAPHPFSVFNDFNHESSATKYFVDRVNRYWVEEFKIDGYRFDLSKGFTQTNSSGNVGLWGQFDQSRIDILTRMADSIWAFDSSTIVILEHFAENSEETVFSDEGMLLWNNMNYDYNEATMGYPSNLSGTSYLSRGWGVPHLISYMESHDEERLMYKNLQFGNSGGNYDIQNFPIAIQRIKLAAAFYFTIPGVKMIWQFGELGFDFSINYPCMTNNCRTDPKPIRWDYFNDGNRNNLFKVFQALIKLKKDYTVFNSPNHSMKLNTFAKRLTIIDSTMNINVIGNFAVTPINMNPEFPNTGWWYDFFSGDSISVSDVNDAIPLEPGEFHIYSTVKLPTPEDGILSDVERVNDEIVENYQLKQNYPNPFNPSTTIKYSIVNPGNVSIKIYDLLGRVVKTLVNEFEENGNYQVTWSGENNFGRKVNSGIYFYRIEAGLFVETKKMILMK
ncbi:MAG: alpha-amylase family glycosyl hydrolase, partial [Ignavibacteria bacterium]|nr:alpha-amylase family glycosyl hydrolase [Ignavibacteria bacterium]